MSADDLAQVIEQYHRSIDAAVRGDAEPQQPLWSRRDDVTLANPIGPPVRGYDQVARALAHAVSQMREGEPKTYERVSEYATPELAYIVEIERTRLKIGGSDATVGSSLRVTTIFRREEGGWRIVHRHADPTTAPRPITAVVDA